MKNEDRNEEIILGLSIEDREVETNMENLFSEKMDKQMNPTMMGLAHEEKENKEQDGIQPLCSDEDNHMKITNTVDPNFDIAGSDIGAEEIIQIDHLFFEEKV